MKWIRSVIVILISGILLSCATRKEIVQFKDDTQYLRQQIFALRQENQEMRKMLLALNKAILSIQNINQRTKADLLAELESLKNQSQIIDSKLVDTADRMSGLIHKVETPPPPQTYETIDDFIADTTKQVVVGQPPAPTLPTLEPKKLYDTAYLDLTRGNYQLALQGFEEYLSHFPESEFADNAQYWIGEVYYAQQDYQRAIEEFKKVVQNYPKGEKVPAALLKIGFTYLNLNAFTSGKKYLNMVIAQFPNSEEARLARSRLATLE